MDKRLWLITTGYPGIVGHVTRARSLLLLLLLLIFLSGHSIIPTSARRIHTSQVLLQSILYSSHSTISLQNKEFLYSRQNISNVNTIGKFILGLLNVQYIIDNSSSWWILIHSSNPQFRQTIWNILLKILYNTDKLNRPTFELFL